MDRVTKSIIRTVSDSSCAENIRQSFLKRIKKGGITRDENGKSHLCVFFAAFDSRVKKAFFGHHIVSNSWMFCGGHMDIGESLEDTLKREVTEEWGKDISLDRVEKLNFLTISEIDTPNVTCKRHYDVWYFIPVDSRSDRFDKKKLGKEFSETKWLSVKKVKTLAKHSTVIEGIDFISNNLFI